jgi:hypothetical protein
MHTRHIELRSWLFRTDRWMRRGFFGLADEFRREAVVAYSLLVLISLSWLVFGIVPQWLAYPCLSISVFGLGLACFPLIRRVRERSEQ